MPIIALQPVIDRQDLLHFLSYPEGHEPPPRIDARLTDLLSEARSLVDARGGWRHLDPSQADAVGLPPMEAAGLVVGLVTIGIGLEERAGEYLRRGDGVSGLILDAAGSAAAEEAADLLGVAIVTPRSDRAGPSPPLRETADRPTNAEDRARPGISCRISPGYGKWDLSCQRHLFAVLPHQDLGVHLLPSLLMVPRKSISFAMWLGSDSRPLVGLSGCGACLLETCRYRRPAPGNRRPGANLSRRQARGGSMRGSHHDDPEETRP